MNVWKFFYSLQSETSGGTRVRGSHEDVFDIKSLDRMYKYPLIALKFSALWASEEVAERNATYTLHRTYTGWDRQ